MAQLGVSASCTGVCLVCRTAQPRPEGAWAQGGADDADDEIVGSGQAPPPLESLPGCPREVGSSLLHSPEGLWATLCVAHITLRCDAQFVILHPLD